jgi:hypothetical protein
MSNTDRAYTYASLRHSDSIRLIELHPGVRGSPLSCSMTEVQIADHPKYEALSYAWGEPGVFHTIEEVTRSSHLRITANLHDALQAIRHEHASRVLWIDAICINQFDLPEKGHQVASMGKIYGDAWRVIVWLGCPKFAISRIIDVFTEIVNAHKEFVKTSYVRGYRRMNVALVRLATAQLLEQPWYVSYVLPRISHWLFVRPTVPAFLTTFLSLRLILSGTHVCGWFKNSFSREIYNSNSLMASCHLLFSKTLSARLETCMPSRPIIIRWKNESCGTSHCNALS